MNPEQVAEKSQKFKNAYNKADDKIGRANKPK